MNPIESDELFEEDPEMEITEQDDGSAIIALPMEIETKTSVFSVNLAEKLSTSERFQIASDLIEAVEKDKESRKRRHDQYEEGIRRSGLGDDAPGGAQFNGASRVVHPLLAEACVDFEARAIKEILPAGGPVKISIYSEDDPERLELATLKRDILNLQLTKLIPEFRDEMESMLSQLPMGGSQYIKMWHDGRRKRVEFVPVDHLFIPYQCTNFYTAPRATHQQFIDKYEFASRVDSGLYLSADKIIPSPEDLDRGVVEKANDKVEGKDDSDAYNEDGLREIYEIYLDKDFTEVDDLSETFAPYIAHVDVFSSELLGLYRNWEEGDDLQEKLHWIIDYGFIPWRGAYKLGLPHLIGSLSGAATGALRALLDSAHISNAPTLLKLKAGRLVGQTTEVAVTQVQEVEGPAGIDDVRKLVSPVPFAGPNPVLFQLLGFLVETGKGVVATAEEKIADVSDRMPVGTSLAMIEQGSKVFAAIHMRLHASQARLLEVLCRLNAMYPDTDEWERMLGKRVDPEIFRRTDDISPVSDPNIFSEAQRFAQMQAVMQMASDPTIPYNRIEVHRRMMRLLNVADSDKLLPEPPKPKRMDPVPENMAAVSGIPLKAFPDQDHLAHMEAHLRFILSPAFGAGPAFAGPQLAPILAHCGEHLTMYYPQVVAQGQAMAVATGNLLPDVSPEQSQASGSAAIDVIAQKSLGQLLQMMQQAQQLVQSKMPPPPMDPQAQVTMQVAQMEDARAKMEMQGKMQLEQTKMQGESMRQAAEMEMKQAAQAHQQQMDQVKLEQENRITELQQQVEMQKNALQQETERQKNESDNRQHQMTELLKNENTNNTKMMIEKMKMMLDSKLPDQRQDTGVQETVSQMKSMLEQIHQQKLDTGLTAVIEGLRATIDHLGAPKMIVHDAEGNPIGLRRAEE